MREGEREIRELEKREAGREGEEGREGKKTKGEECGEKMAINMEPENVQCRRTPAHVMVQAATVG